MVAPFPALMALATASLASPRAATAAIATRTATHKGCTYSATVAAATASGLPPLVLLPPIGVGIDRTFCGRFVEAWANDIIPHAALHAIDVIGMGDSSPKPRMKRRPLGGWDEPPRTPVEWAEQVIDYIENEVGEPCVVVGQSNLCTVALEAVRINSGAVKGVVLIGPPAVEALSIDKPQEAIDKLWRIVGSPIGAALYRFARRKAFLGSFSTKNLFADPSKVDEAYLETCARGAADASTRHAVFSFVAGTWRRDYRELLATLALPTLIVSGRDVGSAAAAGGGVGKAPPPEKPQAVDVDKSSFKNLLSWFKVWRRGRTQETGRFDQVGRDLGLDPEAKLRDFAAVMTAASASDRVETALLPGWNVLVYESPQELASCVGDFVSRRFS